MTKVNNFSVTANDSMQISASANEKGIQIFNNQEFGNIRVVMKEDAPFFCLSDVCKILEIGNTSQVKARLEDGVISNEVIYDSLGRKQQAIFINEDGLYDAIFESRKPEAKQFRKWVTSEVLPSIRKHGMYATDATIDKILADPDFGIRLLVQLKEERAARIEAETKIKEDAPKVEFYDAVTDSKDAIDMRSVATTLNMGIGRNKIFEILREHKILDRKNIPYQKYIDMGYFRTVETSYSKPSGDTCINIKTVVFQKGLDFIRKVINRHRK